MAIDLRLEWCVPVYFEAENEADLQKIVAHITGEKVSVDVHNRLTAAIADALYHEYKASGEARVRLVRLDGLQQATKFEEN